MEKEPKNSKTGNIDGYSLPLDVANGIDSVTSQNWFEALANGSIEAPSDLKILDQILAKFKSENDNLRSG